MAGAPFHGAGLCALQGERGQPPGCRLHGLRAPIGDCGPAAFRPNRKWGEKKMAGKTAYARIDMGNRDCAIRVLDRDCSVPERAKYPNRRKAAAEFARHAPLCGTDVGSHGPANCPFAGRWETGIRRPHDPYYTVTAGAAAQNGAAAGAPERGAPAASAGQNAGLPGSRQGRRPTDLTPPPDPLELGGAGGTRPIPPQFGRRPAGCRRPSRPKTGRARTMPAQKPT